MTIFESIANDYPYLLSIILIAIGLWGMIAKHNLVKKLIGMNIFQTAIIMFFICAAFKWGGTVPTIDPNISSANPALYINPVPHVLMLTAIVVMVATGGVSLAMILLIYRRYHTLDEREIIKRMKH
jgi:multicomponent Na+:H+ antiporter subunit C